VAAAARSGSVLGWLPASGTLPAARTYHLWLVRRGRPPAGAQGSYRAPGSPLPRSQNRPV